MTVYPVEFQRRVEQKWACRAGFSRRPRVRRDRATSGRIVIQATEPERERLDGFSVSRSPPNRARNTSACAGELSPNLGDGRDQAAAA